MRGIRLKRPLAVIVGILIAAVLGVVLAVLAFGAFIGLAIVSLVLSFMSLIFPRWRPRVFRWQTTQRGPTEIEGNYRVVETEETPAPVSPRLEDSDDK
jgi:hypothetical protein